MSTNNRRKFLQQIGGMAAGVAGMSLLGSNAFAAEAPKKLFFDISLAQWSLHKTFFSKELDTLDFPEVAKKKFGISTVEYVNQFFKDKANDKGYLKELLKRSKDNGVKNHLIMIDEEGALGDLDKQKRVQAVENHYKWVDAAKFLGCATVRVNAFGTGEPSAVKQAAADGLSRLGEYAGREGINVIVENHGGLTSDASWLAAVMREVNRKNVGTLPDFGNFCIARAGENFWEGECINEYDRYKGTKELMPFAKGVSAKTFDFDAQGNCVETDYTKMMRIINDSGFRGYMGIEYEGSSLSEEEGIRKTKALLERIGANFS
ncbi:sugar phosphate isomerase/epimerase family protein [Pontibacter harenae]|uniref:sugar phosphate isomerase/epimerase family protein n=1 Tax=Pontibacter harenae TaxID=2894083 RepID=UPI001E409E55|nr:sugar phosphate isomerase/epimerase family protein [Pontibacter harenae]MCC9167133.1 sugar phosphate isomerase/epimerase [Pontibacter harenae]